MSRLLSVALAAAVVLAGAASAAEAGTITLGYGPGSYSGSNGGGEFSVTSFTGSVPPMGSGAAVSGSYFQTFCVEHDEFVTPGTSYNFKVSTAADNGGANTNSGDPLGCRTAYLYTQFWNGTLSDYDYQLGAGRAASATALQQAIWYLENEVSYLSLNSQAKAWVDEATDAVSVGGSWYEQYGTGIGNVRVMNMYTSSGARIQDQLILVPLPPAAYAGLAMLAFLGVAYVRRRRAERIFAE